MNGKTAYTVTKAGKIRINRDLKAWRSKKLGRNHWEYHSEMPHTATAEKEVAAAISRCTKELSLDQECAVAVKAMKKQEYLDHLAEI